jgi:hypothetical protein
MTGQTWWCPPCDAVTKKNSASPRDDRGHDPVPEAGMATISVTAGAAAKYVTLVGWQGSWLAALFAFDQKRCTT